jgi:hypothetical protein
MTCSEALARFALLAAIWSCQTDGPAEPRDMRYVIEALSPPEVHGVVGSIVQPTPIVAVKNRQGAPVAGVTVTFLTAFASGIVPTTTVNTDSAGIASPGEWRLSGRAGRQRLRVSAGAGATYAELWFEAEARTGNAVALKAVTDGGEQVAFAGAVVVNPPTVRVVDSFDNGIEGVAVTFSVSRGGGSIARSETRTDSAGSARAVGWQLGPNAGPNEVLATAPGFDPVTFTAQAIDRATVRWYEVSNMELFGRLWQPVDFQVDRSLIALTVFDGCLCRDQTGYFVEELDYWWRPLGVQRGGRYRLNGDSLFLMWGDTVEQGQFADRELRLVRVDYDYDWVGRREAVWIYVARE